MNFPDWAPDELVEIYKRNKALDAKTAAYDDDFFELSEPTQEQIEEDLRNDKFQEEQFLRVKIHRPYYGSSKRLHHEAELRADSKYMQARFDWHGYSQQLLEKLLTNPSMKKAWKSLYKTPRLPDLPIAEPERGPAYHLWHKCIFRAYTYFNGNEHRSKADRKESLNNIAADSRALVRKILEDDDAARHQYRTILDFAVCEHIDSRIFDLVALDESELMPDFQFGHRDVGCATYRYLEADRKNETLEKNWEDLPESLRMDQWIYLLSRVSLVDALNHFASIIEHVSKLESAVKQPGRGRQSFKAFLIRCLHEFMTQYYGQPLDDTVGIIVSTLLDLPNPLTRNDIRSYHRETGKKSGDFD